MKKNMKLVLIFILLSFSLSNIFSARLFYLSTEKTFSESEDKRIKIESEYNVSSIKLRVYKIVDPIKFYNDQKNFHKPIIDKRKLRYYTPRVIEGFSGFFRSELRNWSREIIPSDERNNILGAYPDFAMSEKENDIVPNKIVNAIKDKNFELVKEIDYSIPEYNKDWNYNYIFLNDLKSGMYLIEGVSNYNVAYTVLNVSQFGFIIKKANEKFLVYTVNNENGQPEKKVDITIYDRFKKEIKKIKTNDDGLAVTSISDNEIFIMGKSSVGNYSFYDPKYYSLSGRDVYVYIYTDRPVYRGNDVVNLKGVIRSYKDDSYNIKTESNIKIDIIDSSGNIIKTINSTGDKDGIFTGNFTLPEEPITGKYLILAEINGKKYEGEFKVEFYKKPEYQVSVIPKKNIYIAGTTVNATVKANYYFGDAVKNGKLTYSIYRTKFSGSEWEKVQSRSFYITEQEYQYSQMELLDTKNAILDKNGTAEISFQTKKDNEPYNYSIQATVINDAGIPIGGSAGIKVVPSDFKINISNDKFVYLINEKINVSVFTSDYSENPVSTKVRVKISTETTQGNDYIFFDKEVKTDKDGNAEIEFKAEKNGFVKIEAEGKDKNGNISTTEKYLWIGEKNAAFNYKGGMIKLVLDKKVYKTGDTAKLLIISPVSDIKFLYTIEGDSIYENRIEKLSSNSGIINIPVKGNYLPNVFVNISYIFNNQVFENSIKIDVPPLEKFVDIKIIPEKNSFEPKSSGNVKIKVIDINNKPVKNTSLSIAVVDEAIYAISPEIAVDVYKYFYPFRRNNVATFSSIGFRFYGYSMDVNSELSNRFFKNPTGLAAFKEGDMKERKDFKDTVLWIPNLQTDENGEANFVINFASNITKWRITAVGITPDTKVGKNISSVITKYDFFTELTLPNYLNEKDSSTIYSTTHNYSAKQLETNLEITSDILKIEINKKEAAIEPGGTNTLEWKVTPSKTGNSNISLTSSAGNYKDKITKTIPIIPHSILKTNNLNKTVSSKENTINYAIPENLKNDGQEMTINLSFGYFSEILDSLPYLINYPYGCVEQTTSSFLPDLVAVNSLKKLNIKLPEIEKKLPDIVNKGLSKLYNFQNTDGTWGWWKDGETDIFMTSYVLYALTLTKNLGYQVDKNIFAKGLDALTKNIQKAKNDTEKVYALYVLSLNNKKFQSIREDLHKRIKNLGDYDLALLLMTDYNYNFKDDGKKIAEELKTRVKKDGEKFYWGDEKSQDWYKDSVETTAWVVRALYRVESDSNVVSKAIDWIFNKSDFINNGVQYLISEKTGENWKSTRDTAAVVFAITDLLSKEKFNIDNKKYSLIINKFKAGDIVFNKNNFWTELKLSASLLNKVLKKDNEIIINGIENEKLFLSFSHKYYTNDNFIKESASGIKVERNYYKLEQYTNDSGNIRFRIGSKISSIAKNENFIVEVKFSSDKKQSYLMTEDYFPAGCIPIKDFLLYTIDDLKNVRMPDFIDFKDNRVVFFADKGGQLSFYYVLTPVFKGNYKVLPASASLMYFPDVRGNSVQNDFTIQ